MRGGTLDFLGFANSLLGLLTGLLTLLLGILKLLPDIRKLINRVTRKEVLSVKHTRTTQVWGRLLGVILLLVSMCLFAVRMFGQEQLPMNADLTVRGWKALDAKQSAQAITFADSCIGAFGGLAEIEQAKLDSLRVPPPATGAVPDSTREFILSRGVLNDVATCWFIKGRAMEQSGQKAKACEAYRAATRFPHARCWDSKGWFWSPAEGAAGRLRTLKW